MIYLISQLWPIMIAAFVAGIVVDWGRGKTSAR
jgi:hypothetical protein